MDPIVESEEIWKPIPGYERYHVSNMGNVKNTDTGRLLKPFNQAGGYKSIDSSIDGVRKRFSCHRLVASVFISNDSGLPQVDHIDRVRHNNKVSNLRWVSLITQQKNKR